MNFNQLLTKLNPFSKKQDPTPPPIEVEETVPEPEVLEKETVQDNPIQLEKKKELKATHKVNEHDKQYMVTMLASGLSPSEVAERAEEELGIKVTPQNIYMYGRSEKWQPLMRKIRQEVMTDLASVSGSHKKVRLERAEKVYDKAMDRGKLDVALKATEHQRREMEEQGGAINLTLNQFNVLSDEELQLKQKEVMEKIQRLSQKKGITLEQSANKTEAVRP